LVAKVRVLQQEVGLRAELDRERGRDVVAVGELLVAVAVGFLARDVEAIAGYSFGC
jgi:hypothetical protein